MVSGLSLLNARSNNSFDGNSVAENSDIGIKPGDSGLIGAVDLGFTVGS
jgi:hypothetical protein